MEHKDVVVRVKAHCFDSGQLVGHPPTKKTMEEVVADIERVNAERGCEIMTLVPATKYF